MTDHALPKPQTTSSSTIDKQISELGLLSKIRAKLGLENPQTLRETIEDALESDIPSEEDFSNQERLMLLNLLRFGELKVEDVMVPRADIIAFDESAKLDELLRLFEEAGHSRIPVYKETLDDPTGMVHIKDLMQWIIHNATGRNTRKNSKSSSASVSDSKSTINLENINLSVTVHFADIQRNVLFVPPSMSVVDLLLRMQSTRVHMALVIDEYGGTDGLVTIEDLVEEIVGEIEDEHDSEDKPLIIDEGERGLVADARTPIGELEAKLNISLNLDDSEEDEFDTLGGLVFTIVGRVPVRGELVRHPNGIEIEVLDADPRRLKRVRVNRK
ncbi:MAG: hemolysin family protein [Methyloligellaceae bacterium]